MSFIEQSQGLIILDDELLELDELLDDELDELLDDEISSQHGQPGL
jgi:hypothetical protein